MAKPLHITKLNIPVARLRSMAEDHRHAFLFLGLLLNEVNWLRKLLVRAVLGITDGPTPDGEANFGLTFLLATTLAGKIHEGWNKIANGRLHEILGTVDLPPQLRQLRQDIEAELRNKTFRKIRNEIAFHYPKRMLDFRKLAAHIDDSDTVIYLTSEGYQGDIFSRIAVLAGIEPLVALSADQDYRVALQSVWDHVMHVTGLYCLFVSEAMGSILREAVPCMTFEDITISDAPEADEIPLRFFAHPPSELAEIKAVLEAE